jgi:ATP-dependent Clp protease ATP-binding subunit ClpA
MGSDVLAALDADAEPEDVREDVMNVVKSAFRPEFLNR